MKNLNILHKLLFDSSRFLWANIFTMSSKDNMKVGLCVALFLVDINANDTIFGQELLEFDSERSSGNLSRICGGNL